MKDYYRILGIKDNACSEDIRSRWIELMRKFHPDGKTGEGTEDPRLKEINEAYHVLKHPSARAYYDLRRAYHRKERSLYLQRMVTSPAILVILFILFILGLIYLQRPRVVPPAKSTLPLARGFIQNKTNLPFPMEHRIDEIDQTNQISRTNRTNQTNPTNSVDSANQTIETTRKHISSAKKLPKHANPALSIPNQTNHINETNLINQIDQKDEINQINETNQTNPLVAQVKPPSPITEEEVRQFLEHYKKQYVQQDIDGFLSLFSPKAVQNGRDGIDEIKKIYSDFFHQSHEIRYHLEDTGIEIYQEVLISGLFHENAAVVEARYQVDQTLVKKGEKKVLSGDIRWILVRENGALKILYLDFKHKKSR